MARRSRESCSVISESPERSTSISMPPRVVSVKFCGSLHDDHALATTIRRAGGRFRGFDGPGAWMTTVASSISPWCATHPLPRHILRPACVTGPEASPYLNLSFPGQREGHLSFVAWRLAAPPLQRGRYDGGPGRFGRLDGGSHLSFTATSCAHRLDDARQPLDARFGLRVGVDADLAHAVLGEARQLLRDRSRLAGQWRSR